VILPPGKLTHGNKASPKAVIETKKETVYRCIDRDLDKLRKREFIKPIDRTQTISQISIESPLKNSYDKLKMWTGLIPSLEKTLSINLFSSFIEQ